MILRPPWIEEWPGSRPSPRWRRDPPPLASVGAPGEGPLITVCVAPRRSPLRSASSMRVFAAMGSPWIPRICMNRLGQHRRAAGRQGGGTRRPLSGRRAHHTWRRLGAGNGVIGVRSRRLSMPISAIGSHVSMRRCVMLIPEKQARRDRARRSSGSLCATSTRPKVRPVTWSTMSRGDQMR